MDDFENSAQALNDFAQGSGLQAADDLARVFEQAGDRIANSLERAARRGEFSFNALASSVAQDLTRLAVDQFITGPITDVLGGALGGILGGAVGGAVGGTRGGNNTTVNLNVSGMNNPQSLQRSQGQISAAVARAVASGQRYI